MEKDEQNNLNDAIKFLKRYKYHFQLDEDDIQEILIRFNNNYDSTKGGIKTFLKTVIKNHNISKWRTESSPKYAHTAINIDDVDEEDSREWLMAKIASDDINELEKKELLAEQKRIIELALEVLTPKQRLVIEKMFFEYLNSYEIAAQLEISHQSISLIKYRALDKMNLFFEKNNIKMVF